MCNDELIRSAIRVIMKPVLDLIQEDPHLWSTRPCPTCKAISSIIGKPFGCTLKALEKKD